jgi:hypothetical protein
MVSGDNENPVAKLPLIRLPAPSPRHDDGEKGVVAPLALHLPSPRLRGEGGGSRVRGMPKFK